MISIREDDSVNLQFNADLTSYVVSIAMGDDIARNGDPTVTRSVLLLINKIDLAPWVGTDWIARGLTRQMCVRIRKLTTPTSVQVRLSSKLSRLYAKMVACRPLSVQPSDAMVSRVWGRIKLAYWL